MTTISNNPISKSFIVGRPINATVSQYDVVTLNITLTDERGNIIDLTGCSVVASTVDTEAHLWNATVQSPATDGKFSFTFQPLVVGKCEANVMVTKTIGQDDVTTTFYLGDISVAFTEGQPAEHIISLTTQLQEAATNANTATTNATTAATNATNAATTANTAASSANAAATNANTKAELADTAATNANTKAELADSAATTATNAAATANTAADRADDAAQIVEDASITVGTVTSGATPSITNVGSGVNPIFNFVLPKGDPGVSVTVGTTTTGAAGTSASVTNSGTASDPILDFVIPKGDSGVPIIDDTTTAVDKVWSSSKTNTELSGKQATLTSAQLAAVNSGINTIKVAQIATNQTDIATINNSAVMNSGVNTTKIGNYDTHIADTDIHVTIVQKAEWSAKANASTTLAGYGITDAYTKTEVNAALGNKQDVSSAVSHTASTAVGSTTQPVYIASNGAATPTAYSLGKSVPADAVFTDTITTAIVGGGGNAITSVTCSNGALTFWRDKTFLTSHQDISGKADKATTLAGYGITDAKIESGSITLGTNSITPLTSHQDISGKENISNKVTSISSLSTDTQYPSAKCVYDIVGNIEALINAL